MRVAASSPQHRGLKLGKLFKNSRMIFEVAASSPQHRGLKHQFNAEFTSITSSCSELPAAQGTETARRDEEGDADRDGCSELPAAQGTETARGDEEGDADRVGCSELPAAQGTETHERERDRAHALPVA